MLIFSLSALSKGLYLEGLIFGILIDLHVWGPIFGWGQYIQGAYRWDLTDA